MRILYLTLVLLVTLLQTNCESTSPNYDPAELLTKIFNLEDSDVQERNILPERVPQHITNEDFSYRNEFKRKKRRRPSQVPHLNHYNGNPYPYPPQGLFYERPSFAADALSRVTEALTSISLYDDYQCVPRLLCEAAGGGALGSSLLQSVSGLQPLLTLLAAYSGVSSNPLFVFGRAVLLGMSTKENKGTCRYAYPLCPTDPEKLVHYLNNHNGGFFRFFNSPQGQNVEQFYNHLQGYGLQNPQNPQSQQQNQYGLIQNPYENGGNQNGYGFQNPNPYTGYQQNYGFAFPYKKSIESRIQNRPNDIEESDSKWTFPEHDLDQEDNRRGKELKFPVFDTDIQAEENKRFVFPNFDSTFHNNYPYVDDMQTYQTESYRGQKDVKFSDNRFKEQKLHTYNSDNFVTVYVVRGNGDPNKPEIVKLRPGQSLL